MCDWCTKIFYLHGIYAQRFYLKISLQSLFLKKIIVIVKSLPKMLLEEIWDWIWVLTRNVIEHHSKFFTMFRGSWDKQVTLLDTIHKMFQSEALLSNATRQAYVDRSLLILLLHCSLDALKVFLSKIIVEAMETLKSRFTKVKFNLCLLKLTFQITDLWSFLSILAESSPRIFFYFFIFFPVKWNCFWNTTQQENELLQNSESDVFTSF